VPAWTSRFAVFAGSAIRNAERRARVRQAASIATGDFDRAAAKIAGMVLNLAAYLFTAIDDPRALADAVRERAEALSLRGTVLVAPEGINAFLAGDEAAVDAWLHWLRADPRFAPLHAKLSRSRRNPFARLKVKVKREIIAFRRERTSPRDVGRASAVSPDALARWLAQGHDDEGRRVVLLDTRNREEVGHGSFENAVVLPIDNFVDFPEAVESRREEWRDATIVPFCTGGIRCEKAAHWMQQAGFAHVHQLEGGILGWFEAQGGAHYTGRCFVFDERVALDPQLRPAVDAE
jgi:UPF0176 protein